MYGYFDTKLFEDKGSAQIQVQIGEKWRPNRCGVLREISTGRYWLCGHGFMQEGTKTLGMQVESSIKKPAPEMKKQLQPAAPNSPRPSDVFLAKHGK